MRRGSAAIEFALTLPFLLMVVMGIVELSLLMSRVNVINRAARDASRVGTGVLEGVAPTGELIEAAARNHALFVLESAGVDCGAGCDVDAEWFSESGWMFLRVSVGVPYTPFTRLLPMIPETTRAEFVMLTQQQVF